MSHDTLILATICLIELVLFLGLGAMRPDMQAAIGQALFWWKLSSLGIIALVGATVAILSFDPVCSPRRGLRRLVALVAVSLIVGWFIDASRSGWPRWQRA